MKRTWIFIIVALIIGGFIGLYIGFIKNPSTIGTNSAVSASVLSPASAELSANMRQLWEDRITWTRMYIIDLASNNGFADVDLSRLMKNQEELGNLSKPYFGNAAGNTVTKFLKQDISTMSAFAKATKSQDSSAQNTASTQWYANAKQITNFLIKTNPNFANTDLQLQIQPYLDSTKKEIKDIFDKNYQASIGDYDTLTKQTLQMADTFSSSIRQQFPDRF